MRRRAPALIAVAFLDERFLPVHVRLAAADTCVAWVGHAINEL